MKTEIKSIIRVYFSMLILASFSCFAQKEFSLDISVRNIENGLIDAGELGGNIELILDKKRTDTVRKFNISDRMKAYRVPGVSIAVIKDYQLSWAKGYGVMEAGKDNLVTTRSLFQAASCSKPLAVVIVLRLVEQGKLDLDEDVNTYLKSWKIPYDTIRQKVTLRLLITHKSGINQPGRGYDYAENSSPTLAQVLQGASPAINDPFHFDFIPGTTYQYSNFGYMIIQMILEDLLNKPYGEIVRQYIFDPLNMRSSLMSYPVSEEVREKLSKPHDQNGIPQPYGLHPSALANAGLLTTPPDFSKFVIELMLSKKGSSELILDQKSSAEMLTQTAAIDPGEFSGFTKMGFGVFLMGEGDHQFFAHPGGNNAGASCAIVGSVNSGDGVIIMTNGIAGLYLSMEILAAVAHENNWPPVH